MLVKTSLSGAKIRLPDERWLHIVEGHPEMARYIGEVLLAVTLPDYLLKGNAGELLAVLQVKENKVLVVIYAETNDDGFILTAFFTKQIQKLLKRSILWQK